MFLFLSTHLMKSLSANPTVLPAVNLPSPTPQHQSSSPPPVLRLFTHCWLKCHFSLILVSPAAPSTVLGNTDTQMYSFVYLFFEWTECTGNWSEEQKLSKKCGTSFNNHLLGCGTSRGNVGISWILTLVVLESLGELGKKNTEAQVLPSFDEPRPLIFTSFQVIPTTEFENRCPRRRRLKIA